MSTACNKGRILTTACSRGQAGTAACSRGQNVTKACCRGQVVTSACYRGQIVNTACSRGQAGTTACSRGQKVTTVTPETTTSTTCHEINVSLITVTRHKDNICLPGPECHGTFIETRLIRHTGQSGLLSSAILLLIFPGASQACTPDVKERPCHHPMSPKCGHHNKHFCSVCRRPSR